MDMLNLGQAIYGMSLQEAVRQNVCIKCKQPADETLLRTPAEQREHKITGLCGLCWDDIFSGPEK